MKITRRIIINAPIEDVWHTSAIEFDKIGQWSSGVDGSSALQEQASVDGADMSGRVCLTNFGQTYETFIDYSEEEHRFTYQVEADAMPFFVREAFNTWKLTVVSDNQTELSMSADLHLNMFPGVLMHLPMTLQGQRALQNNLEELKHYIETGQPHPRKLEAMQG